jgi:hypothetical protein
MTNVAATSAQPEGKTAPPPNMAMILYTVNQTTDQLLPGSHDQYVLYLLNFLLSKMYDSTVF